MIGKRVSFLDPFGGEMSSGYYYVPCSVCGVLAWTSPTGVSGHCCSPLWGYRVDGFDGEDEWTEVRAFDAEEAAEKAAESYDECEYSLMKGGEIVVHVRNPKTGEVTRWRCIGETVPQYSAQEIEGEEA